jgi:two-component system, NtrC family, sensor histidine kinase PilS
MARTDRMLRWLITGRLIVATALFLAALANWFVVTTGQADTLVATIGLLSALGMSAWALWWTELRKRLPGRTFLYAQVTYDAVLVTAAVHITGGPASPFPPLYILVITAAALLVPLPGGLLVGGLASVLFFADMMVHAAGSPTWAEFLRAGLFVLVAGATAALGDRLRRTGTALGAVESELRQLRLDTGEILAAIDTALVTVDGTGRLVHMNSAAEMLLGGRMTDWMDRPVLEELDRSAPGLGTLVRRTATTRMPVGRFDIRQRSAAGDRYLGVRTTVLERDGMPWVTAVVQDITEGKQIEDLIRRAERLQAVAELGASLAHEIKNPLASIRSAAEQLAADRLGQSDRQVLRRLVVTESERLSRLLSEFMEFSRVEMRRWASVDMDSLAAAVIELVSRHPDRNEATRIQYTRPRSPLLVTGDRDLLHRAVFNLVLNAVQHTGESGTVTVELDQPKDDLPPSVQIPQAIRLTVQDTGPGIREEDIGRLFDPFFTTRAGGMGLGLAMVHRAVEAHRGAILVDSPENGGARFMIYLPAHGDRGLHYGA